MKAATAALLAVLAGPAAAVTPTATENALDPAALAVAAPGLAACLAMWEGTIVTRAALILLGRDRVSAGLLHPDGTRIGCAAAMRPTPIVTRRWTVHRDNAPRIGPRAFAAERRCTGARAVAAPDTEGRPGAVLGWLEDPPCR